MRREPALLILLLIATSATPVSATQKSPGASGAASPEEHRDPYAGMSPQEAMAMHWQEQAARRGGKFICTNPAHYHSMSPQMHWLIEGGDN